MEMKKELIVALTGINAIDNPGPGIGVARSLKEDKDLNIKIVGLAYDAMDPGIYMDWLIDKAFMMPYPSGEADAFLSRLSYIKDQYGIDFIIPTLDAEMPLFIKYKDNIEGMGIKTFLPSLEQFKLRGKDQLHKIAEKINILIPQTQIVTSIDELVTAANNIGFPVMIKGAFYKAYRATKIQEAIHHYNHIVTEWGYPIIVQQVIAGEEMNLVCVGDGEGHSLGSVGIKKMWITSLGKIWTGITIKNDKMIQAAHAFLTEYKWKSAFELECIVKNDLVYLIEINPRFPAWSYFATGIGVNLPSNMLRKAFNFPLLDTTDYPAGKLYVRYTYELVTDMLPFQQIATLGEKL